MHDAQPLDLRVSEPHNEIYEEHVDPTRVPSKNLFSGNSNLVWKQGRVHKKESYIYITSEIRSLSARRCNNSYQMRDSRHFVLTYLSGYHSQAGKCCFVPRICAHLAVVAPLIHVSVKTETPPSFFPFRRATDTQTLRFAACRAVVQHIQWV